MTLVQKNVIFFFLAKIHFDYAIIDEASQTIEPLLLGPISLAEKFILIGDYFQVLEFNF